MKHRLIHLPIPAARCRKTPAFSLLELMVSIFLINLVLFAIIAAMCMFLRSVRHTTDHSEGMIVATSILDSYIQENKTKLKPVSDIKIYGDKKYQYQIQVNRVQDGLSGKEGLFEVTVHVSWLERDQDGKSTKNVNIQLSTLMRGEEL